MEIQYGRMRPGQEVDIARLIRRLISDYGTDFETELTPEALRDNHAFLNIEVAESAGTIIGLCAWVMSFSTWRGIKGMYIADLYVTDMPNRNTIGRKLLHLAAKSGAEQGARFIRTEVDVTDEFSETLFDDIGFWNQTRHSVYFLEPTKFGEFVAS